jgi:hypothetical protein
MKHPTNKLIIKRHRAIGFSKMVKPNLWHMRLIQLTLKFILKGNKITKIFRLTLGSFFLFKPRNHICYDLIPNGSRQPLKLFMKPKRIHNGWHSVDLFPTRFKQGALMKLFYFSDASFLDMKVRFEKSMKDDFEKNYVFIRKVNLDRSKPGGGIDIWKFRTELILKAIQENMEDIIIVSDIDIVFYKSVIPIILESMQEKDICFQRETREEGINVGFISMRCNEATLGFWQKVYSIITTTNAWEQEVVNTLIYKDIYPISWGLFPSTIWCWSQGNPTTDIALHHANCVAKKDEKFAQMEYIRALVD